MGKDQIFDKSINAERLPRKKESKKPNPRQLNHTEVFVFEVLVHVFVLITILSIFFFTIVSTTEKQALNNEVTSAIENGIDQASWPNQPVTGQNLIQASNLFKGESQADANYNLALTYSCITLLVGLFIAMICVWGSVKMVTRKRFPIFWILLRNILLFGVIGCIEFVFFLKIATRYVPVLPSYTQEVLREDLNG